MESLKKIIVIGNGMVGHKLLEKLVDLEFHKKYQITVCGEEPRVAYDRVNLSRFFDDSTKEADLELSPLDWYRSNGISLFLSEKVTSINRNQQTVETTSGVLNYDILVLATGSSGLKPKIPGLEGEGVFVYRTVRDLEKIQEYAHHSNSAAVIGGGLLGLEAVKTMIDMEIQTHILEQAAHLMPSQLDNEGAEYLKTRIEWLDVNVHLAATTEKIIFEDDQYHLYFRDGKTLSVDMIVVSAGIVPRDQIAQEAGLEIGSKGGIAIDSKMTSSDPNIFAIGECVSFNELTYGLVAPGFRMAEALALNLMGEDIIFSGSDSSTSLKTLGVDVSSFGNPFESEYSGRAIILKNQSQLTYRKLVLSNDGKQLIGGILVGDSSDYINLLQIMRMQLPLPSRPETLLLSRDSDGDLLSGSLPDHAMICSCENKTKGAILKVIRDLSLKTTEQVVQSTHCGISCGSCIPMLDRLLKHEIKRTQTTLDNTICRHFHQTRKELRKKIKEDKLNEYGIILKTYGEGEGCDLCFNVVNQILERLKNPSPKHLPLDNPIEGFISKSKKRERYVVSPRAPGGEFTPEQLSKIGELSSQYALKPKINLAQHIDLFDAQLQDLPQIWEGLVRVGLKSGHANGKALSMMVTCLGSQWCGHALNNSTALSIKLEKRYKNLPGPNKLRGAVSGCVSECSGAITKDFGVVATEQGWNLFVGGKSGLDPQKGSLIGKNLSEEALLQLLDRFLIFYLRNSTRRERIHLWIAQLEGGVDSLRKLLIAPTEELQKSLEEEMALYLDPEYCDWQKILETEDYQEYFQ